ncbi:hypothetical protein [Streptomyces sp. Wb2n-11]|uniref:hypothetical protein n=1 Tax=Streptomyces sp. Wb2n-11 TaxID=1030533 RepID=UPI002100261F|nr:hypothetical protein [Streptomyces sp. Wb2n-11]
MSKDTGETATVPNYPTDKAIALYRRQHQPDAQGAGRARGRARKGPGAAAAARSRAC